VSVAIALLGLLAWDAVRRWLAYAYVGRAYRAELLAMERRLASQRTEDNEALSYSVRTREKEHTALANRVSAVELKILGERRG
jgi:hypothetical protein